MKAFSQWFWTVSHYLLVAWGACAADVPISALPSTLRNNLSNAVFIAGLSLSDSAVVRTNLLSTVNNIWQPWRAEIWVSRVNHDTNDFTVSFYADTLDYRMVNTSRMPQSASQNSNPPVRVTQTKQYADADRIAKSFARQFGFSDFAPIELQRGDKQVGKYHSLGSYWTFSWRRCVGGYSILPEFVSVTFEDESGRLIRFDGHATTNQYAIPSKPNITLREAQQAAFTYLRDRLPVRPPELGRYVYDPLKDDLLQVIYPNYFYDTPVAGKAPNADLARWAKEPRLVYLLQFKFEGNLDKFRGYSRPLLGVDALTGKVVFGM